jgi:hypothetical protein
MEAIYSSTARGVYGLVQYRLSCGSSPGHSTGGTGKLVCPWGLAWSHPTVGTPSKRVWRCHPSRVLPRIEPGRVYRVGDARAERSAGTHSTCPAVHPQSDKCNWFRPKARLCRFQSTVRVAAASVQLADGGGLRGEPSANSEDFACRCHPTARMFAHRVIGGRMNTSRGDVRPPPPPQRPPPGRPCLPLRPITATGPPPSLTGRLLRKTLLYLVDTHAEHGFGDGIELRFGRLKVKRTVRMNDDVAGSQGGGR